MTTEEKAKAYDEALEDMRVIYPNLKGDAKLAVEHAFPQLRESEDERNIDTIFNCLYQCCDTGFISGTQRDNALAWLEKQKEQKPNIEICPHSIKSKSYKENGYPIEDCDYGLEIAKDILEKTLGKVEGYQSDDGIREHQTAIQAVKDAMKEQKPAEKQDYSGLNDLERAIHRGFLCAGVENVPVTIIKDTAAECMGFLALIEPKPAEWSEDYREEDIQTRFAFYTYKDDSSVLYLSNVFVEEASRNHGFGTRILKAAEKAAEAIGAITICLKVKQDSPANAWYRKRGYGYVTFEDGYDWLEKNLEYLKPAKSAEWSEEDEKMLVAISKALGCDTAEKILVNEGVTLMLAAGFLDSLRPQPHWKPSEEQMGGLKFFLDFHRPQRNAGTTNWREYDAVESLYKQLKKL